jgi:hypothetical protein
MWKSTIPSLVALFALASVATAQQGGWLVTSSNTVSPLQPTTTIEVWAWYDNPQNGLAFALGDFDFVAGDGLFSNEQVYLPVFGAGNPGSTPGTVNGSTVEGVLVGQLFGMLGWFPNQDNPIRVWSADWTTTNFAGRAVNLDTSATTQFVLGDISTGATTQLYPQGFSPGTGIIQVVPTPASAVPMVVVGALILRRRR